MYYEGSLCRGNIFIPCAIAQIATGIQHTSNATAMPAITDHELANHAVPTKAQLNSNMDRDQMRRR